jgi:hypothetical protein
VSDLMLRCTILAILSLGLVSSVSVSGAAEKDEERRSHSRPAGLVKTSPAN